MLLSVAIMRVWGTFLVVFVVIAGFSACGGSKELSPVDTLKEYVKAMKKKDTTSMKLLLSNATMKMHEQEAKAQGTTVDEIVKRETLFTADQTTVNYRNEKIDGDKATVEVKNSYGSWETVPFVREDGQWKIDKAGYADQMIKQMDDANRRLDDLINNPNSIPTPNP